MNNKLTPEQQKLVVDNLNLVPYLAKKLNISYTDYDDVLSAGKMGLLKAAQNFILEKGYSFSTYASRCIQNEFYMFFRKKKKLNEFLSLDAPIVPNNSSSDFDNFSLLATLSDDTDFTEQVENHESIIDSVNTILNRLSYKEKVVMLCDIGGLTQINIAEMLNISQSYVSRLMVRTRTKFMNYLERHSNHKNQFSFNICGSIYSVTFRPDKNCIDINKLFEHLNSIAEKYADTYKIVIFDSQIVIMMPAFDNSFIFLAEIIIAIENF